jgi:hypothetical protein
MPEQPSQVNQRLVDERVAHDAGRSDWQMGWTKHGTVCMTRAVPLLNRPLASDSGFEQYGAERREG